MSDEEKRFSIILYDGVNLFYKGQWTTLEFSTLDEGREMLPYLNSLSDEEAEQWIEEKKFMKLANKTFKILNTIEES